MGDHRHSCHSTGDTPPLSTARFCPGSRLISHIRSSRRHGNRGPVHTSSIIVMGLGGVEQQRMVVQWSQVGTLIAGHVHCQLS